MAVDTSREIKIKKLSGILEFQKEDMTVLIPTRNIKHCSENA